MAKRNLSDYEIGLIKGMLAKGMPNDKAHFYFNRIDRLVSTGRITQIKQGVYGPNVPAADAATVDAYIASFEAAMNASTLNPQVTDAEPSILDRAKALFQKGVDGHWRLKTGETDEHECKQDFDAKKLSPILRAIAALSNNKGGFLFLGVSNTECRAEGVCSDFESFDVAKITDKVKTYLSPTPRISAKGTIDLGGTKVGFIHVAQHPDRPVIVCRDDGEKLNEGEILFRYAGQSARIKFGDLREMLSERDRRAQMALATAAGKLATVGTAKALILDTDRNVLDAEGREILIDEDLVKTINFIREGHFDEVDGGVALKLVGEVKSVNVKSLAAEKLVSKAISQEDILTSFLNQETVGQPKEFVFASLSQPRLWLPLFYFTKLANETPDQMVSEIKKISTSQKGKKQNVIDRLGGKKSALTAKLTQKAQVIAKQIEKGEFAVPAIAKDVAPFAQSLSGVKKTKATLPDILNALSTCRMLAIDADDSNALGAVFKAACRVDEMFFKA